MITAQALKGKLTAGLRPASLPFWELLRDRDCRAFGGTREALVEKKPGELPPNF